MKYLIPLFILAVVGGSCYGVTPSPSDSTNSVQSASTNSVAKAKAAAKPAPKWSGTVTAGLTATAGNVNSVLATTTVITERKTARDDLKLDGDGAYGQADGVKSAESLHGSAQEDHTFIDNTWYGYGRADGLHDAIADVAYRFTTSVGAGYYFIKDKQTTFSGEAGPAFEAEKLDDEYHDYPTARLAEDFERKIDEHARVWENVEFIPPVTFPDAFLVNAQVGVETPLTHKLSLQTYLQDNFANVPAPGYKDNDVKLVSALVFKF